MLLQAFEAYLPAGPTLHVSGGLTPLATKLLASTYPQSHPFFGVVLNVTLSKVRPTSRSPLKPAMFY